MMTDASTTYAKRIEEVSEVLVYDVPTGDTGRRVFHAHIKTGEPEVFETLGELRYFLQKRIEEGVLVPASCLRLIDQEISREQKTALASLFERYPLPWYVDDNRPPLHGVLCVYAANGTVVLNIADMEDAEGPDLLLASLLAAAPLFYLAAVKYGRSTSMLDRLNSERPETAKHREAMRKQWRMYMGHALGAGDELAAAVRSAGREE